MRTTININHDLMKKVIDTAEKLNLSKDALISNLINIVISKNILNIKMYTNVQYQDVDPVKNWCILHINFSPQDYEKNLDLRKFYKLSVSFIISFAIIHFLDDLVIKINTTKNKKQIVDNYSHNYICIPKDYDGIQGFIVIWGIPEEKYLKKLIS